MTIYKNEVGITFNKPRAYKTYYAPELLVSCEAPLKLPVSHFQIIDRKCKEY